MKSQRSQQSASSIMLLLMGFVLVVAASAWGAQPTLPNGVPNIYDPAVRDQLRPVAITNLHQNPDLPALLLANTTEEPPSALLLGFDARNGKDTWSWTTDPIILFVVFGDATTVREVYVDIGFVDGGKASGTYAAVDAANASVLPDLLSTVFATGKRGRI